MIKAARCALTLFTETTARSIAGVPICSKLERMWNKGACTQWGSRVIATALSVPLMAIIAICAIWLGVEECSVRSVAAHDSGLVGWGRAGGSGDGRLRDPRYGDSPRIHQEAKADVDLRLWVINRGVFNVPPQDYDSLPSSSCFGLFLRN
jgi:hypothetical protein